MPSLTRDALDEAVAAFNEKYKGEAEAAVDDYEGDKFVLAFQGRADGAACVDQHFNDVQWQLKERTGLHTQIIGGEFIEERGAFLISYEVVHWD